MFLSKATIYELTVHKNAQQNQDILTQFRINVVNIIEIKKNKSVQVQVQEQVPEGPQKKKIKISFIDPYKSLVKKSFQCPYCPKMVEGASVKGLQAHVAKEHKTEQKLNIDDFPDQDYIECLLPKNESTEKLCMKKVPRDKICRHLDSKAHGNQKVLRDQTFRGWLKIEGKSHTAVIRSKGEPNPPDEEEVEIDETNSNSVDTELPNDVNTETQEDVMPSDDRNTEPQEDVMPTNDENSKSQQSLVIVVDSGGNQCENLTHMVATGIYVEPSDLIINNEDPFINYDFEQDTSDLSTNFDNQNSSFGEANSTGYDEQVLQESCNVENRLESVSQSHLFPDLDVPSQEKNDNRNLEEIEVEVPIKDQNENIIQDENVNVGPVRLSVQDETKAPIEDLNKNKLKDKVVKRAQDEGIEEDDFEDESEDEDDESCEFENCDSDFEEADDDEYTAHRMEMKQARIMKRDILIPPQDPMDLPENSSFIESFKNYLIRNTKRKKTTTVNLSIGHLFQYPSSFLNYMLVKNKDFNLSRLCDFNNDENFLSIQAPEDWLAIVGGDDGTREPVKQKEMLKESIKSGIYYLFY